MYNRLFWSNGTIERLNMSLEDCERLYNILVWASPSTLRSITLATQRLALKDSRMPSIFAQASALQSVTILNGATDHILRLIGINCPQLQVLDVSHSSAVTIQGMKALLLRFPRQKNNMEKNACAKSLNRLILLGTGVKRPGFEFVCQTLDKGYSISFIPDEIIVRVKKDKLKIKDLDVDLVPNPIVQLGFSHETTRGVEQFVRRYVDRIPGTEDLTQVLDIYEDRSDLMTIFVRDLTSSIINGVLRIELTNITELVLPWDSFTWRLSNIPELTDLGTELPNLKILKARIQGTWDRADLLLPHLNVAHVWCINDSTILSFLQHSPVISKFTFNCLNFNNPGGETPWNLAINDTSVQEALTSNVSLRNNVEEFCIRPGPKLSTLTVIYLLKNCPQLLRLGDMESWKVSPEQIRNLNVVMDQTNSKCILTVLSFPPKETPDPFI